MGFLANVIHPAFLLVHGDEQVAGVDNIALAHIDAGNGAVLRSADLVLHLHGLEDQQGVASLDGAATGAAAATGAPVPSSTVTL